jgi:hypothetical protein
MRLNEPNEPAGQMIASSARRSAIQLATCLRIARGVAFRWLDDEGCPAPGDGRQAQLQCYMEEWLSVRGHKAGEATAIASYRRPATRLHWCQIGIAILRQQRPAMTLRRQLQR